MPCLLTKQQVDGQVMSTAALFTACKLCNVPVQLQDCATVIMYAALKILAQPVFSAELQTAYGTLVHTQGDRRNPDYTQKWEVSLSPNV